MFETNKLNENTNQDKINNNNSEDVTTIKTTANEIKNEFNLNNNNHNNMQININAAAVAVDNNTNSNISSTNSNNSLLKRSNSKKTNNTVRHKEFHVVIVHDDDLLKEQSQQSQESTGNNNKEASLINTTTTTTTNQQQQQTASNDDTNVNNAATSDLGAYETLPVDDGYATRKMDEHFRQTIEAIKEELTKKFEESQQHSHNHQQQHGHHTVYDRHHSHHPHQLHHRFNENETYDLENINDEYELNINELNEKKVDDIEDFKHHHNQVDDIPTNVTSIVPQVNTNCSVNQLTDVTLNTQNNSKSVINCVDCLLNGNCIHHNNHNNKIRSIINWFIIIGSLINHVLIDGFCFNYTNLVFYIEESFFYNPINSINSNQTVSPLLLESLINQTDSITNTTTAKSNIRLLRSLFTLPGALLFSFYLLFIPISIYLNKRFGIRVISIIGTLVTALSVLISSFIRFNFALFIIFFSVFNGIGLSLIYIPSVLIISEWPYRRRLFSNTIALCGTSVGICLYPIISDYLLKKFALFDTLFILSALQLNFLIGSLLLISYKDYHGVNHHLKSSNHHQHSHANQSNGGKHHQNGGGGGHSVHIVTSSHNKHNSHNQHHKDNMILNDDESAHSTSIDNFTIKQHWRRFCQTRKSNTKGRKNLFHLIAEEKRKSRALSKGSLEDGFVITTSNNLLAPDDPNVVLLSRKAQTSNGAQATQSHGSKLSLLNRIAQSLKSLTHHGSSTNTSNDKHSHHTTSTITTSHHVNNTAITTTPSNNNGHHSSHLHHHHHPPHHHHTHHHSHHHHSHHHHHHLLHTPQQEPIKEVLNDDRNDTMDKLNEIDTTNTENTTNNNTNSTVLSALTDNNNCNNNTSNSNETTPKNLDLLNVFIQPNEKQEQEISQHQQPQQSHNNNNNTTVIDCKKDDYANFATQNFHNVNYDQYHNTSSSDSSSGSSSGHNSSSNSSSDDDDHHHHRHHHMEHDDDDDYSPMKVQRFMDTSLNDESFFSSSSAKSSRYMSYRNSLTNSVKGSLIECSVPEDQEEYDDDNHNETSKNDNKNNVNHSKSSYVKYNNHHHHPYHHGSYHHHHHHSGHYSSYGHYSYNNRTKSHHKRLTTTPNTTIIHNLHSTINNPMNNITNKIMYYNERIKKLNILSIVDTASMINLPLNTKPLSFNINNSFIKTRSTKNTDKNKSGNKNIFKKNSKNNKKNVISSNSIYKTVNLFNYLKYLYNKHLILNPLIMLINFTFAISTLGFIIPIFYLMQYLQYKEIEQEYSIYILSTIGLASAIGRCVSTVVYKSNNENYKNRIFAYNLSILLVGLITFMSTFCSTLFTFTLFSMGFGGLLGFNLCLRSIFLYDLMGLEWSDDSLFVILTTGQGIALLIGLPIAGFILDIWNNYAYVYYFSCVLLIISGILTIIGSKLIEFFICTHKSINKYYLKKRM